MYKNNKGIIKQRNSQYFGVEQEGAEPQLAPIALTSTNGMTTEPLPPVSRPKNLRLFIKGLI